MLTISASETSFELPPAGPVAARCCRVVDLGTQQTEHQGQTKMMHKVLISWELAERRSDGSPFYVSRRFTASLREQAALRAFLEAWRGRPFSKNEIDGFDLRRLVGVEALLNLVHVQRAGKDYANIAGISPLPRGMAAPELSAPPVVFDIDADDALEVLELLPPAVVATIERSPEWQARMAKLRSVGQPPAVEDDDIAF